MKKLLLLLAIVGIFISCNKNDDQSNNVDSIQQIKAYVAQLQSDEKLPGLLENLDFSSMQVLKDRYVVDAINPLKRLGAKNTLKYVFYFQSSKVVGASIYGFNGSNLNAQNVSDAILLQNSQFDGKVSMYSVKGKFLMNYAYQNGKIISNGIMAKAGDIPSKKLKGPVKLANTGDGLSNCTDWYMVTTYYYQDGTSYTTEEYLGTTCDGCEPNDPTIEYLECPGTGSGGGGGDPEEVTGYFDTDVTSTTKPITLLENSAASRAKKYVWTALKNSKGFWSIISYDKGTHILDNGVWKWQSLIHEGIDVTANMPGTIEASVSMSNVTLGLYNAAMELRINTKIEVSVLGNTWTKASTHPTAKIFNIND